MSDKLARAFAAFDAYNKNDPNIEIGDGKSYPKELLYSIRMTEQLERFAPDSAEYHKLAARCQHIGRWEIPRNKYPMDKKGYLQWRNTLKQHHATIADKILTECGYDSNTVDIVKFLLLKKQLYTNPDTQLLEDVICLVFVEYYLDEFADKHKHEEEKVVDIVQKTLKKMSPRAISEAVKLAKSERVKNLLEKAVSEN
ncbi:MAG TPA: DUF4202 domain-containing protein [Cyclobacteriaceae bacterium]|nr:DUF4202 domain-containing protein [Cyclobacteriaceae bacterium]